MSSARVWPGLVVVVVAALQASIALAVVLSEKLLRCLGHQRAKIACFTREMT